MKKISNRVNPQNPYRDLIYKRGYIITDQPIDVSELVGWDEISIDNYYFYFDKENEGIVFQEGENWCFLLGYLVDMRHETDNKKLIAENVCKYLINSENAFFDYIDEIAGRYLIMYKYENTVKILGDATCMRTIFYSKKYNVIASHTGIIQQLTGLKENPNIKKEWREKYTRGVRYYIPGNYTPFEDIYFLTPNLVMDVESKTVNRFFPRENIVIESAEIQAKRISDLIHKQFNVISKSQQGFKNYLLSLSAGEDSRTTLSFLKNYINEIQTFTYYNPEKSSHLPNDIELERDSIVVKDMAENLNIKGHITIPLSNSETSTDFEDFCEVARTNTFVTHKLRAAYFYKKNFKQKRHIRSNIYEIGRAFYWGRGKKIHWRVTPKTLTKCFAPRAENDNEINKYFEEFYNYAEMDKLYNYNPYDVFYWEYRMGTWHSHLLLESDLIHDTYIVVNTRKILSYFLSVSYHDKVTNKVCKSIIKQNWPILFAWGLNSYKRPIDRVDEIIDSYGKSLDDIYFVVDSPTANNIDYYSQVMDKKAKFYMISRSPKKGDKLSAIIPLKTKENEYYECILELRSLLENAALLNSAKYHVYINDKLLLTEDLAAWKEKNQIRFSFQAEEPKMEIIIKLVFNEDCNIWKDWEDRTTIIIEHLVFQKSKVQESYVFSSSPYSVIYSD